MSFSYNTQKNTLVIMEYGRNIQSLIEHAITIEDDQKRNKVARYIIELMGQMNPGLKNIDEFRHKLWDHLFLISDFKLDVESPYPIPSKETLFNKPQPLAYPEHDVKYKHYGKNVEALIEKASSMEDGKKKKAFTELIGSYMKMVSKNWNREYVNDENIIVDIKSLSGDKLEITRDADLDLLNRPSPKRKKKSSGGSQSQRHGGYRRKKQ